jgi:hypothetical protein
VRLEDVLADLRGEAAVLRANGHGAQAQSIERACTQVAESMAAYLDWLSEDEAHSRSGKSVDWLRQRFPGWLDLGLARLSESRPPRRQYRRITIPIRANLDAARADARRQAESAA